MKELTIQITYTLRLRDLTIYKLFLVINSEVLNGFQLLKIHLFNALYYFPNIITKVNE